VADAQTTKKWPGFRLFASALACPLATSVRLPA
jgi:hypothetical protein